VTKLHGDDQALGYGEVFIPDALARKLPNAAREIGWQYLFGRRSIAQDDLEGAWKKTLCHTIEDRFGSSRAFVQESAKD